MNGFSMLLATNCAICFKSHEYEIDITIAKQITILNIDEYFITLKKSINTHFIDLTKILRSKCQKSIREEF